MQDVPHGAVQQAAIVADDENRVRVARQVAFQPERAFEVEVVGRFIQQKQIGLREQHAGQRHAHSPAARESGAGHRLLVLGKAQPLQDGRGPRLPRPGVDIGQPCLHLGDTVGVLAGVRQQGRAFLVGCQHRLQQREFRPRRFLRHAAHTGARRQGNRATIQRQLSPDQAEKRRLARPVAPDDAHLVARRNGGTRPLEQGIARNGI
jgi:hypothetical protein